LSKVEREEEDGKVCSLRPKNMSRPKLESPAWNSCFENASNYCSWESTL